MAQSWQAPTSIQGGGSEIPGETLVEAVDAAAKNALVRLFPNFTSAADDPRWATVVKRAGSGNGDALTALGFNGDTVQHPICKEVLSFIGSAGQRGGEVRKRFTGAGYGWPQDTVDGALMALLASNIVRATKNGQPVAITEIPQGQIGVLDYEAEEVTVSTGQLIQIRGFLSDMGYKGIKSGEEVPVALRLLSHLQEAATAAGGESPLPPRPGTDTIDALQARQGNALLAGLYEARGELQSFHKECQRRQALIGERMPKWMLLGRLLDQAHGLPTAGDIQRQVEAIRSERSLLAEPDPVTPLLAKLSDALRQAVHAAKENLDRAREREVASLAHTPEWNELSDGVWETILHKQGLGAVPEPDVSTDKALLDALMARPLSVWDSEAAAMPTRLQKAREEAAQRLNPKAIRVPVPSATLQNEAEVDAYLHKLRGELMKYIDRGKPVIL